MSETVLPVDADDASEDMDEVVIDLVEFSEEQEVALLVALLRWRERE